MSARQLKSGYFVLEGLNSFAMVFYSYYLYFFMQSAFGFDNKANLALAALGGIVSMFASWWGGKFAQRFGYFTALKLGLTFWLECQAARASAPQGREFAFKQDLSETPATFPGSDAPPIPLLPPSVLAVELNPRPIAKAKTFLRLAWLANPFAYIAINT